MSQDTITGDHHKENCDIIVPPQQIHEIVPPQPVPVIVPPQPVPVIRDNACIIIQKHSRGYLCRNDISMHKKNIKDWKKKRECTTAKGLDIIPKDTLRELYQTYRHKMIDYHNKEMEIGFYLGRIENFPENISENIVLHVLRGKNINCTWNTKSGDILYEDETGQIKGEVKCQQNGPSQFSPSSKWDTLFYIDAKDHLFGNIKIYMIKDIYEVFKNIKISKTQTVQEQSEQGRRPRSDLGILLSDYCINDNILFNGRISSLLY